MNNEALADILVLTPKPLIRTLPMLSWLIQLLALVKLSLQSSSTHSGKSAITHPREITISSSLPGDPTS
jgi:hypothetical protein